MSDKTKPRQRNSNPENDLLTRSKQAKEVLEQRKQEIRQQETVECTFAPKINLVSQRLAGSKASSQKCEELYQEARDRKLRREATSEEMCGTDRLRKMYSFKPEIVSQCPKDRDGDIFMRLSTQKKEETPVKEPISDLIDPATKQPLFRPQTGRPPKNDRKRDLPIGDYLYQCKKQDSIPSEPSHQPTQFSKFKTESLLRKRKREQFRRLFETLKPKEEKMLQAETMQLEEVSEELVHILEPLVEELQDLGEGLEFEDFATAMENLMERLAPVEKAVVLGVSKKVEPPQDHSFRVLFTQPTTNSSSKPEISRPGKSLYERSLEARQVPLRQRMKERVKDTQAELEWKEVSECTFRPLINRR